MPLSTEEQVRWWGAGVIAFLVAMYFLGSILMPYILGAAIAYFLDPIADRFEKIGASRALATVLTILGAFLVFLFVAFLFVPFLAQQTRALVESIPAGVEAFRTFLAANLPENAFAEGSPLRDALTSARERLESVGLALLNSVLTSSLAVFDFVLVLIVTPVVAFYLLLDWDRMIARIDSWLPLDHRDTIRDLAREVDNTLNSFLRGQLTVMAFLGGYYAIGMMLVGLNFALFIGLFAGLISFIPYVGTAVGAILAVGIALYQFWGDWIWIGAVVAVFASGQFIEGNILTPKLVGDSVGLHPVTLMFALSAFGLLFGFAGLLIAVPVAASIGVLVRFALRQYLQGRLYKGQTGRARDEADAADI